MVSRRDAQASGIYQVTSLDPQQTAEVLGALERRLTSLEQTVLQLIEGPAAPYLVLTYPEPIATSLAREQSAAHYHEKFFSLLDVGETSVRYIAALVLAVLCDGASPPIPLRLMGAPISLGSWAGLVAESSESLRASRSEFAEHVTTGLFRSSGKPTPANRLLLSEFVNLRNRERGHGSARPEGVYEGLYRRHVSEIHDSLKSLPFLNLPLVRVEQINFAGGTIQYDLKVLMGPSPMGRIETARCSKQVSRGETCLWDWGEELLALDGLLSYVVCDECGAEHTFFLDQATTKAAHYYTYSTNHRIERPPIH